jgi:hypothetical protein
MRLMMTIPRFLFLAGYEGNWFLRRYDYLKIDFVVPELSKTMVHDLLENCID